MSNLNKFTDSLIEFGSSPTLIQSAVMSLMNDASDGKIKVVDPSNPFVFLLESSALTASSFFAKDEANLRKMYPSMATDMSDLYHHMSDSDYIGRFSEASRAMFTFYLRLDEVRSRAVTVPGTAVKKLTIPRDTVVEVNEVKFATNYPIDIRLMAHGGFRVVYDTTVKSPFQTIDSNIVEWKIAEFNGIEYMFITTNAQQRNKVVYTESTNSSTGFKNRYALSKDFYHCRVYGVDSSGSRIEYHTTHSELVYDPLKPTAVLEVGEDYVDISIPFIYFTNKTVHSTIRIELYTTEGVLEWNLGEYSPDAYRISWGEEYDVASDVVYSSPLSIFSAFGVYSTDVTKGGGDKLSFNELKDIVINGVTTELPITNVAIASGLNRLGYDIVKAVDDLTNRVFLATRSLPVNEEDSFTSAVGCSIDTLSTTFEYLQTLSTVKDNDLRLTITPKTLFKFQDGLVKTVHQADWPENNISSPEELINEVNNGDYAITPFYYVLDTTGNQFDVRTYHLDKPTATDRAFVLENDSTQLSVSSVAIGIVKTDNGYTVTTTADVGENYRALGTERLFAQLAFVPAGESRRVYLNGVLTLASDDYYYWEFNLDSSLDIDRYHRLFLDNFAMFSGENRAFDAELSQSFELIYGVLEYNISGMTPSDIDDIIGHELVAGTAVGVALETVTLTFGNAMTRLWSNSRTVPNTKVYALHEDDVPYTWEENVLERDENNQLKITMVDGVPTFNRIHSIGDPVLDINGEPTFKHRKGDPIYDDNGELILIADRTSGRQLDIFLVDGVYRYSTDAIDVDYMGKLGDSVVNYLEEDLAVLQTKLLEKTDLFFYPKRGLGDTRVLINSQSETTIKAAQSFRVKYSLSSAEYANLELRNNIIETTSRVINESLTYATVSADMMVVKLRAELGEDIISVEINKFGPNKDINTYTAMDGGMRCSVKRILSIATDGLKSIKEDIKVDFVRHIE